MIEDEKKSDIGN